jgi:hypothetical protein
MCSNCPFQKRGPGLRLRKSLQRGRWRQILNSLITGASFPCHETTEFDEEGEAIRGTGLLCAGSLEWQQWHTGQHGDAAQVMERFDERKRRRATVGDHGQGETTKERQEEKS